MRAEKGSTMNIITISREFGSGGRELGKRLADLLGYDYYDKEIITAISENKGMDGDYIAKILDNHGWSNFPITFHSAFAANIPNLQVELLLEQRKVITEIAALGKDFIIVGRSADVILSDYKPFNIFVCADMDSKVRRCIERAENGEDVTEKELVRKIKRIDKNRMNAREMIGGAWIENTNYNLTVNTSDWVIKELAAAIKDYYTAYIGRTK